MEASAGIGASVDGIAECAMVVLRVRYSHPYKKLSSYLKTVVRLRVAHISGGGEVQREQ